MVGLNKSTFIIALLLVGSNLPAQVPDSLELAKMHKNIWDNVLFNNPDSAFALAQKHLIDAEKADNLYYQAKAYNTMGVSYSIRGNYENASEYYLKSLNIRKKLNDIKGIASCLGNIGLCFQFQGRYQESVQYFTQSLEMYEQINDVKGIGDALNNIGLVYIELEDYKEAQLYFQKALENYEKVNIIDQQVVALTNIAVCHVDDGALEKALGIYQKALNLNNQSKNRRNQSLIYSQMGNALLLSGLFDSALQVLNKGYQITVRSEDAKHKAAILFYMGKTYLHKGDSLKAQKYLIESLESSKNIAASTTKISALKLLAMIYSSKKDYHKAYKYIQLHSNLNDSLRNNEVSKKATRAKFEYEYDKKKALDDQMRSEQRDRELLIRYFLLTIVIIVAVFVVLLYLRYKLIRKQKNVIGAQAEELKSTNEKLIELDQFKESMTHMVVHDFKNSINTVVHTEDHNQIKEAGRNMHNLVMNMLEVQKYENTTVELKLSRSSTEIIVNEAIHQVRFNVEKKGIVISKELESTELINIDGEAITRVIVNLLTNAIKFSPTNSKIVIASTTKHDYLEFSVADQGHGINPADHDIIFDKYVTGKGPNSSPSTGLGLSYCKIIVEAHGGRIWVQSVSGIGTMFKFTLPLNRETNLNELKSTFEVLLTPEDQRYLEPFVQQLSQFRIFEYTRIKEVLSRIEIDRGPAIAEWLKSMESILQKTDESAYRSILGHAD